MTKRTKPDCYECKWNGGKVPGTVHICCKHPSVAKLLDNPELQMLAIFGSVGRAPLQAYTSKELNIKADPHGIKMGWFNFPFMYDPVWLDNCDGFELKPEEP